MTKSMKQENIKGISNRINSDQVTDIISKASLSPETTDWLNSNSKYITDLINVYADDPDTYGLHQDLRNNPLLVAETILYSAETLHKYQEAYNKTLIELAKTNGVDFENIADIPMLLQNASIERERPKISAQLKSGGYVAIGLMGSGASGKGTIGKRTGMDRVVNYTTRFIRPGEEHGKDYLYIRTLEPEVSETLDIDTGIAEDKNGNKINYFDKYGPYITVVHRPGRARHGTSIDQFKEHFGAGKKAIFFEHGPIQVQEAGEKLPQFIDKAKVFPVCVLPPKTGILPLALRIAVRTYGDKDHQDTTVKDGYKIQESYLESTIGLGQITELAWTANFLEGDKSLGITYIVNDNLMEAVQTLQGLISTK
ncbi:hypothetical protein BH10PAT1_BH10PAT1_3840 [soil metagenome]